MRANQIDLLQESTTNTISKSVLSTASNRELSRNALKQILKSGNAALNDNSLDWAIYSLIKEGIIHRVAHGTYRIGPDSDKRFFEPDLSSEAIAIMSHLEGRFPLLEFALWETRLYNEFISHQIAKNTIIIEVERLSEHAVFEEIRTLYDYPILLQPTEKELNVYSDDITVIVSRLTSEAPIIGHRSSLEKLLVDLVANKLMKTIISPSENKGAFAEAGERYSINTSTLLRYARRRGKEKEVEHLLEKKPDTQEPG